MCGKVYMACVRLAMIRGSEMLEMNVSDLQHDHSMICWICGTKDWDETGPASVLQKLAMRILRQAFAVDRLGGLYLLFRHQWVIERRDTEV